MSIQIDEIIKTKRKTIALMITNEAHLVVRAPIGTPLRYIKELVSQKEAWIRTKQELVRNRETTRNCKSYVSGEEFLFLGESYKLMIVEGTGGIYIDGEQLCMPEAFGSNPGFHMQRWYAREAGGIIQQRVEWFSQLTGIPYQSFRITGAKHRWGSCGTKGNLNFAWRLIMAPLPVVDYVVIHELAHVLVRNHSRDFWAKVRSIMPHFASQRAWLKENQSILDI